MIYGRMPSIPEYYKDFIDAKVDLFETPSICCPFHKENTPSFSYSIERRKWRCFGACKCGGGVVELHQKNYKLKSKDEALSSLKSLYRVKDTKTLNLNDVKIIDDDKIENESAYQEALILANAPDKWIELDYIMSKYPVDMNELKITVLRWKEEIKR